MDNRFPNLNRHLDFKTWVEAQDNASIDRMAKFRYGHYCGPGPKLGKPACNILASGQPLLEPIDDVDAACQVHDIDYCQSGTDWRAAMPFNSGSPESRRADLALVGRLQEIKPQLSGKAKLAAGIIQHYFTSLEKFRQSREVHV